MEELWTEVHESNRFTQLDALLNSACIVNLNSGVEITGVFSGTMPARQDHNRQWLTYSGTPINGKTWSNI